MAYRVPRRFIVPPQEPPPYGLFALSFVVHAVFILSAGGLSAYVQAQADQSKIYIVNLVPAAAPLGSPRPRVEPPAPPAPKVEERTPPKSEPAATPRPKETPPPKAKPVDELPPPRTREVAREVPRSELALPKKVEKETPALETPAAREKLIANPPFPPPVPPSASRAPEPLPRVTAPAPPPPVVATARPVDPMRLGRPDSAVPTTGSISLDVSDFPFTYYLRQIQAKISERWAPPRGAVAGGERVIVLFEIGRDGQIKEPAVEKSSGNAIYDQSAVRAVMDASPFPPLPPEFKAASLKVHFGFEFRPEQG
ncbi:MAG TPA: TonB family protein [Methylomirabilota bacterium]|jgi:TonB family protein|nr:TonB family protein [Methylomirabilota bacterium]